MVEINLLPWRTYQQLHQRKIVKRILLLTLLFTLFTLIILHHFLSSREIALITHIDSLQKQIPRPKQFIKQALSAPEVNLTTLLEELKKMSMHDVCFTEILHRSNHTTFMGIAHSPADLTDYLKNWRAAYLYSHININKLEQKTNEVVNFRFEAIGLTHD